MSVGVADDDGLGEVVGVGVGVGDFRCDGAGDAEADGVDDAEAEAEGWGEPDSLGRGDFDGVTFPGDVAEGVRKFAGAGLA